MEGDDGLEAAGPVLAEDDLFVSALVRVEQGVQDIDRRAGHIGHCGDSQVRSGGKTLLKVGRAHRSDRVGRPGGHERKSYPHVDLFQCQGSPPTGGQA
ncbi:hypothetical protein JCM13580A_31050 [Streptomyces drozdowiczii]